MIGPLTSGPERTGPLTTLGELLDVLVDVSLPLDAWAAEVHPVSSAVD